MATRHERVVLDLDDNFSAGMLRAAAAASTFDKSLGRTGTSTDSTTRSLRDVERQADRTGSALRREGAEIDRLSGRLSILANVAVGLGPALLPLSAGAIQGVSGLTEQLGFLTIGAGTAVLAFHGLGDALSAVNDARLNPTVANVKKMNEAMASLPASTQQFVWALSVAHDQVTALQNVARANMFPGIEDGLSRAMSRIPEIKGIVAEVSSAIGVLGSEAGTALQSPEWDSWFADVQARARPALMDLGHAIGDVTAGLAHLWQAFMPLNASFSSGLADMAQRFHDWSLNLDSNQGFQNFLGYIQKEGPKAIEFMGSLVNLLTQVVQAAAPISGPTLQALTSFMNVLANIANSPIGKLAIEVTALSKALSLLALASRKMVGVSPLAGLTGGSAGSMSQSLAIRAAAYAKGTSFKSIAGTGLQIAGVAAVASGLTDKLNLTNTATLALAGSMAGPLGAGIGAVGGAFLDASKSADDFNSRVQASKDAVQRGDLQAAIDQQKQLQKTIDSAHSWNLGDMLANAGANWKTIFGGDTTETKAQKQLDAATAAIKRMAAAQPSLAAALDLSGGALKKWGVAGTRIEAAASQAATSFRDMSSAITATDKAGHATSLSSYIQTIQKQAQDAQNEFKNMQIALAKGIDPEQITQALNAGPEGAARMAEFAKATPAQVAALNSFTAALVGNTNALKNWDADPNALKNAQQRAQDMANYLAHPGIFPNPATPKPSKPQSPGFVPGTTMPTPTPTGGPKGANAPVITPTVNDGPAKTTLLGLTALLAALGTANPTPTVGVKDSATPKVSALDALLAALGVKNPTPKINAKDNSTPTINRVKNALAGVNSKTITITTIQETFSRFARFADGGTVAGSRSPYGDKVLTATAPGEEIISNRHGQADKWRPLLKAINNGMADGGTVGANAYYQAMFDARTRPVFPTRLPDINVTTAAPDMAAYARTQSALLAEIRDLKAITAAQGAALGRVINGAAIGGSR